MEQKPVPSQSRQRVYGNGPRRTRNGGWQPLLPIVAVVLVTFFVAASGVPLWAQPARQVTAGQSLTPPKDLPAFDVASVKQNKSGLPPSGDMPTSNFPLGPGDVYVPNGGFFSATNQPLITYILFAYKIKGNQIQSLLPTLPAWVKTERFDIKARAEGNPGKDQMRLMMQSLLADRFKLGIHTETRQMQVLAFVVSKPGKIGPRLQPHPADSVCPTIASSPSTPGSAQTPSPSQTVAGGFPTLCNGIFGMPPSVGGRLHLGGRNLTIGFIADSVSASVDLGRPMVDRTGFAGTFDFSLEWTPPRRGPSSTSPDVPPDPSELTFQEALKEQLGLKLESQSAPMDVIVVDHIEHPSEN